MIYNKIVKHINIPLYCFLSGKYQYYQSYKQLEQNQWLTEELLERHRWKLFSKLIQHAYKNTDYYREVINNLGEKIDNFNNIDSLRRLPVINKRELQEKREQLKSNNLISGSYVEDASGGSTGEPTIFYVHTSHYIHRSWVQTRHDRWSGWDIGDKIALLWGASHDLKVNKKLYEKLKNSLLYRRIPLDAFALTEKKMEMYARTLIREKPVMLLAYASAAYTFAKYLESSNFDAERIGLKGIISSAEKLHDYQREIIGKIFGCPVFDRLGSREVGMIASECEKHEGLHMNADNLIIEFLDDSDNPVSSGESGRIVVTDLYNYAMPFIRYDTGDIGSWTDHRCSCERTLPLMSCVEGRTADFIMTRDGRKVHGEYFTHLFYGIRGLRQFQLIQKDLNFIEIKIIKDGEWDQNQESLILRKIREYMEDSELQINLVFVNQIPKSRSGKLRFTISEINK